MAGCGGKRRNRCNVGNNGETFTARVGCAGWAFAFHRAPHTVHALRNLACNKRNPGAAWRWVLHKNRVARVGNNCGLHVVHGAQPHRHFLGGVGKWRNDVAGWAAVIEVENLLPRPPVSGCPTIRTVLAHAAAVAVTTTVHHDGVWQHPVVCAYRSTWRKRRHHADDDNANGYRKFWGCAHAEVGLLARLANSLPITIGKSRAGFRPFRSRLVTHRAVAQQRQAARGKSPCIR